MKRFNALSIGTERLCVLAVCVRSFGCGRSENQTAAVNSAPTAPASIAPLTLVLAPHEGGGRVDAEIRERQDQIRAGIDPDTNLERLGWLFVGKARESYDAGFYKLAEQCALAIDERQPRSSEAFLLRGHALHSQHRFVEAQALAQDLVKQRGLAFDYGLLGDILVDVGQVDKAAEAYQSMLDLKPDPQGYARAAHIRWLKGDQDGALELMRMAVRGVSPRDPASAAWMHTQLARYLWQGQSHHEAALALDQALALQKNYAPALLLRGRMLLGADRNTDAIQVLRDAANANPLPEYLWALSEALRSDGRDSEADAVELQLERSGRNSDPRTYALFLASHRRNVETALSLAKEELVQRADIFSYDVVAWALLAADHPLEAQAHMFRALALGNQDPRLHFHAAVIAAKTGHLDEARAWMVKVDPFVALLLPSERKQLSATAALLDRSLHARNAATSSASQGFLPAVNNESTAARD